MLEEVHSHIHATDREYINHYMEVDSIVDEYLAEQAKIFIKAYYFAKFNTTNPGRPRNWTQFLNNFITKRKLSRPLSPGTTRELKDTLYNRYGMDFEPRSEKGINRADKQKLSRNIFEMRKSNKREVFPENDAYMILHVDAMRNQKESNASNPYGYKTWYLTQGCVNNIKTTIALKEKRGNRYVMRPEFLINYIAHNPTNEKVQQSLRAIFPSELGLRLGSLLDEKALAHVMRNIRRAYEVDPASGGNCW